RRDEPGGAPPGRPHRPPPPGPGPPGQREPGRAHSDPAHALRPLPRRFPPPPPQSTGRRRTHGPRVAPRPPPDSRAGGQQRLHPPDYLQRQRRRLPGRPPPQGAQEGHRRAPPAARREQGRHVGAPRTSSIAGRRACPGPAHGPDRTSTASLMENEKRGRNHEKHEITRKNAGLWESRSPADRPPFRVISCFSWFLPLSWIVRGSELEVEDLVPPPH